MSHRRAGAHDVSAALLADFAVRSTAALEHAACRHIGSVRDGLMQFRTKLPKPLFARIQRLNQAYCVVRHITSHYIDDTMRDLERELACVRQLPKDIEKAIDPLQVNDPWAKFCSSSAAEQSSPSCSSCSAPAASWTSPATVPSTTSASATSASGAYLGPAAGHAAMQNPAFTPIVPSVPPPSAPSGQILAVVGGLDEVSVLARRLGFGCPAILPITTPSPIAVAAGVADSSDGARIDEVSSFFNDNRSSASAATQTDQHSGVAGRRVQIAASEYCQRKGLSGHGNVTDVFVSEGKLWCTVELDGGNGHRRDFASNRVVFDEEVNTSGSENDEGSESSDDSNDHDDDDGSIA
jgi:hypothetical protein